MNPFRPFVFGLLLGGAAILATILAAQLEDDADSLSSERLFPDRQPVAVVTLAMVHPLPSMAMMPLTAKRPSDRELMETLVRWIAEGDEISRPSDFVAIGPPFLRLSFYARDGAHVEVAAAVDCPRTANIAGCDDVPDAVDLFRVGDIRRFTAPALAKWLQGAWEGEFRMGTWDDFDREWAALGIPRSD